MRVFITALAIAAGLLVLAGYFFRLPPLIELQTRLIDWAIAIAGMAVLVGIFNLVAVQMEKIIGQPETIHNVVAFAFVVNEGISILENLIDIGVPVPEFLIKYLKKMKDKEGGKK